jgi:hypothetical protein
LRRLDGLGVKQGPQVSRTRVVLLALAVIVLPIVGAMAGVIGLSVRSDTARSELP